VSLFDDKPKHECPGCHRPQRGRELCSACERTPSLFPGMSTRPARKMKQQSLFGSPAPKGQAGLFGGK